MSDNDTKLAQAREDLCRFLSACYYEPSTAFAEERLFDSIADAAQVLSPQLAQSARQLELAFASQEIETLLIDYTRLFLGPTQVLAQPYGSSWLSAAAEDRQASIDGLLELYRLGGFELSDELNELPDHVAIELEFLYLLTFTKNQASRSGRVDELVAAEELEKRFVDEHLKTWLMPFTSAVASNADSAFYRELASFTVRCLDELGVVDTASA